MAYVGAMGEQDCVVHLVEAIALLEEKDVRVVLAGDGSARAAAEKRAAELGQVSCGKSCVRFSRTDQINRDGLARILADINRRFVAGERLYAV